MIPTRLNLGCGEQRREGCLNVDVNPAVRPDLVWDLENHPYPLPRDHFEYIYALDVVEHLQDLRQFMEEAHQLLVPGGTLEITTPHFSCANSFTDPTHKHHLGYYSMDYFTDDAPYVFDSHVRFRIQRRMIAFHKNRLNAVVRRIANRNPRFYEQRLCWLFPAWFLFFTLTAVKG